MSASPDNTQLRLVVMGAHLDRDELQAADDVARPAIDQLPDQARARLAEAHLGADQADEALFWAIDPSLERARALHARGQTEAARKAYNALMAVNPGAQSVTFERLLDAREASTGEGGRPKLRVIDNDPEAIVEGISRVLQPAEETVTFADVGGLSAVKKEIHRRIILPFQKPSIFQRFRKRIGGGVLLYGPPGCGKTLLARATAGACDAQFFAVEIADVLDMYIGESERQLHELFENARRSAPAVIFFDEVEALGGKREYSRNHATAKVVSQFLSEMDGFAQNNQGVLILAATNVPWAIDPAFRRPGRFDRVLFVPPPDREAREAILNIQLKERPVSGDLKLAQLAQQTSGYSGADLHGLVERAADEAIERSIETGREQPIDAEMLRLALKASSSTTNEWLTTARNYARYANEGGQYDEVLQFLKRHGK